MKSAGGLSDYLRYKRLMSTYSLTEPEERIINTLDVTGVSAKYQRLITSEIKKARVLALLPFAADPRYN